MAEYIERQAVLSEYDRQHKGTPGGARRIIETFPAADVRPVVLGRWIDGKCNQCGEHAPFWPMASTYYESYFCPNCGATMENLSKAEHDKEQREYEAAIKAAQYCEMYEPTYDPETGAM